MIREYRVILFAAEEFCGLMSTGRCKTMAKINASYETIFVVDCALGDEGIKSMTEKFTSLIASNGEITEVNEWGKKRLAYEIQHMKEGFFYFIQFEADVDAPKQIEQEVRIMDNVLRFLVVRKDEA